MEPNAVNKYITQLEIILSDIQPDSDPMTIHRKLQSVISSCKLENKLIKPYRNDEKAQKKGGGGGTGDPGSSHTQEKRKKKYQE